MSDKRTGRPATSPEERKEHKSVRIKKKDLDLILEEFDTVQDWVDSAVEHYALMRSNNEGLPPMNSHQRDLFMRFVKSMYEGR